jgi:hypothetical protein
VLFNLPRALEEDSTGTATRRPSEDKGLLTFIDVPSLKGGTLAGKLVPTCCESYFALRSWFSDDHSGAYCFPARPIGAAPTLACGNDGQRTFPCYERRLQ